MKRFVLAAAGFALLIGSAQAETRDHAGFTEVDASGRFRVEVATGESFVVTVEGPDASRVRTAVEGRRLVIETRNRPWFGGEPRIDATVRVTLPRLDGVSGARGVTLSADATGPCDDFSAAAAMGAVVEVTGLECHSVDTSAAMGARLEATGVCGELDASAAMGAVIQARELRCETVDASASMGADVSAFASGSYDASASMGADIRIAGEPATGDRSSSMGGSISIAD
jgi:hypothetical protein